MHSPLVFQNSYVVYIPLLVYIVSVKVRDPIIMKYPNQSTYTEGSSIILLTCISNGNPLPTYSWYFNGTFINTGSVLEIRDGRESANGFYICDASNSFNGKQFEVSKSVYIHIISK